MLPEKEPTQVEILKRELGKLKEELNKAKEKKRVYQKIDFNSNEETSSISKLLLDSAEKTRTKDMKPMDLYQIVNAVKADLAVKKFNHESENFERLQTHREAKVESYRIHGQAKILELELEIEKLKRTHKE